MNNKNVKFFSSFQEENEAETQRRREMTREEIYKEFSILQDRRWGKNWHLQPIVKKVVIEKLF